MGGWLSLLAARARPERLAGLVLIAAAPDFTERMLLKGLSPEDRATLQRDGRLERPSQYSPEPSVFTWKLIEEGRHHLVLDKKLALPCPVRLLHGQSDPDVPWEYSLQIAEHLEAPEVITTLIKGGDHRLSTPADIARLIATVEELACLSRSELTRRRSAIARSPSLVRRIAQRHAELVLDLVVPHAAVLGIERARHGAHGRRHLVPRHGRRHRLAQQLAGEGHTSPVEAGRSSATL